MPEGAEVVKTGSYVTLTIPYDKLPDKGSADLNLLNVAPNKQPLGATDYRTNEENYAGMLTMPGVGDPHRPNNAPEEPLLQ